MTREWRIHPEWPERSQAASCWGVSSLVAQILFNRNVRTPEQAKAFLSPKLTDLADPASLPGATSAAEHLAAAVKDHKRITIYGDYDVDGIAASAILWHVLRLAGAEPQIYIPHRIEEGYGLNAQALKNLKREGAQVVVTVDCGISATQEAEIAAEEGLELIITDHHQPQESLPQCVALVHPTAIGESPNPHVCGAGIALKLAWSLASKLCGGGRVNEIYRNVLLDAMGLAALGTVADVVPLTGENRIIARFGLAGLPHSSLVGIRALIESSGLLDKKIDDYAVGFKLAPRLNAAGRMGHANLAVELLTRADEIRAKEIADYLEAQNRLRQKTEKKILVQAQEMVRFHGMDKDSSRAIVLASEEWHAGVIGIVASRLVDLYHKPTVLISLSNGVGQGSARSVTHFEMDLALSKCRQHLIRHGGHKMAAGLSIQSDCVGAFTQAFVEHANNRLTARDLQAQLDLDAEISLSDLVPHTVQTLLNLGPFGLANRKPRLASPWLTLDGEPRCVGQNQDHLQFALREDRIMRKAIGFGLAKHMQQLKDHRRCRVAFEPIINDFRGRRQIELQISDIQFPA